ncbi:DUF4279 domain-containing protein [Pedobacter foliorum]|uniref:DUF4279 domain-containing protein n=1 Tax=Pedobacter foliorum TaxID=2739058 RepID=UPI001564FF38|nr:DUF4279 domain-containing protein [Pedobacter foliorum]NRF37168.1 DUF4279 domain-containing protein [Pedobacter foliorum]
MISDSIIQTLITEEFKLRNLGVTNQYLEILDVYYNNNGPRIERIDREGSDRVIIAYLPIVDEQFYLAVYIDEVQQEIFNIGTESRNKVVFRATSETCSMDELVSLTNLPVQTKWDKGELKPNKKVVNKFSCIEIEPNPEPDSVEEKLTNLLKLLVQDKAGIVELVTNANGYIQINMDFHNGNQLLGGLSLSKDHVQRMAELNLGFDVDVAVWGEPFKDFAP